MVSEVSGAVPEHNCITELKNLYNAYYQLVSGNKIAVVQYDDARTEYQKSDLPRLARLYNQLYATCGQDTGLPAYLDPESHMTRNTARRGFGGRAVFTGLRS